MTEHTLKCWPNYFDAVERGEKNFEVRRDDRGFQKGDTIVLQRTLPDRLHVHDCDERGNPIEIRRTISWVLTGGQFGIEPGYVVLALTND
jgi:hypothetical protein